MFFAYSPEALYRAALLYCYSFLSTRQTSMLMRTFKKAHSVWYAPLAELMRAGLQETPATRLIEARKKLNPETIAEELNKKEIQILCIEDPSYPPLLKQLYDAPIALFFRGTLAPHAFSQSLAVVGTRKITPYGRHVISLIVPALAHAGITIVSGMALGSDGFAHTAALDASGTTIAFLGSGIDDDSLYPRSHVPLAHRIIENGGAILSEYPPGTLPLRHHFPVRNRLIAGSTMGVLVTEAAEDSGSLITARLSLEYGRDVFAIPGPIYAPLSIGPNKLIQMGAHAVIAADDILTMLDISSLQELPFENIKPPREALSSNEQKIISALATRPLHVDEVITASMLENKTALTLLTMLELNGHIKHLGNHVYAAI
ncbi:MAG: putative smf protein [Candidatus Magasanikbacteria bacterium GW2011_GWA2_45_39]|uniref:Putative smf protein n=2 Tax=Candidatus Magasanikiibacteriota TaxID=1752731 RepID=A0A0G1QYG9_9BACT|nr:MAG: putative smf protein [Candidatus Magasanikbacteria bacterium GW2011_GWA2_45_39]KKU13715.1 MAG: putative smf protein [Candidatus Magasanikbacteria bacterium GW2011_GWC2_45_8]HBW73648.1 DNA-protecting protein DprA [Candidatus Magasanikbacteria bacterium]